MTIVVEQAGLENPDDCRDLFQEVDPPAQACRMQLFTWAFCLTRGAERTGNWKFPTTGAG